MSFNSILYLFSIFALTISEVCNRRERKFSHFSTGKTEASHYRLLVYILERQHTQTLNLNIAFSVIFSPLCWKEIPEAAIRGLGAGGRPSLQGLAFMVKLRVRFGFICILTLNSGTELSLIWWHVVWQSWWRNHRAGHFCAERCPSGCPSEAAGSSQLPWRCWPGAEGMRRSAEESEMGDEHTVMLMYPCSPFEFPVLSELSF